MDDGSQPLRTGDDSPDAPRPVAMPNAEPSIDVLRRKLDSAILAERWDAVRVIRDRIVEVERLGVVDLDAERARRRA